MAGRINLATVDTSNKASAVAETADPAESFMGKNVVPSFEISMIAVAPPKVPVKLTVARIAARFGTSNIPLVSPVAAFNHSMTLDLLFGVFVYSTI